MAKRRFPPPWTLDESNNACFIVRDATGQTLSAVYEVITLGWRHAICPLE
jgi:hypothetical protein